MRPSAVRPSACGMRPSACGMKNERGFALLAVMLVLALLGIVVTELTMSMRLEASMVRSYRDGVIATHLAEAGVQQAMREIMGPGGVQSLERDGTLAFYGGPAGSSTVVKLPRLPRERVALGGGTFSYRITDEESRIDLNTAPPDRMDRLLTGVGLEKPARDTINDSLQDWKDPDDLRRINGAESEDYYLKLPLPYRARNGPLQDTAELLQIRGVTLEIYKGVEGHQGLAALVTVAGRETVNMNTVPEPVLKALGFSPAEISDITQSRAREPYTTVPARFGGRGLAVGSTTFRIEAEGFIGGEPRARIVAIVQKKFGPAVGGVPPENRAVVVSWRPDEP
jgi:general secretion pathway protein K